MSSGGVYGQNFDIPNPNCGRKVPNPSPRDQNLEKQILKSSKTEVTF